MKRSYKSYKKYGRKYSRPIPRLVLPQRANKCVDVLENTTTLNTTASLTLLNGIAQGSAFYQRLGNRFAMRGLLLKAMIVPLRTNTALLEGMRMAVVYDRQANGAAPTFSDIFQGRANDGVSTDSIVLSGQNIDKRSRYIILWDWFQTLPQITVTGNVVTNVGEAANDIFYKIQKFIKIPNLPTQCDGATSGIGDIETGSLYLITYGSVANLSESHSVNWTARLFYYDVAQ